MQQPDKTLEAMKEAVENTAVDLPPDETKELPIPTSSPENTEEETKEEKEAREERERVAKMNPLTRMKYNLDKLQNQRNDFIQQKIKFQALATGYEGHIKNIDGMIKQAKNVIRHLESARKNG